MHDEWLKSDREITSQGADCFFLACSTEASVLAPAFVGAKFGKRLIRIRRLGWSPLYLKKFVRGGICELTGEYLDSDVTPLSQELERVLSSALCKKALQTQWSDEEP